MARDRQREESMCHGAINHEPRAVSHGGFVSRASSGRLSRANVPLGKDEPTKKQPVTGEREDDGHAHGVGEPRTEGW